MGLDLVARCGACDFSREDLRIGATLAMMSGERRSAFHLFPCAACQDLARVELVLGETPGATSCDCCGASLAVARGRELRIVTLNGVVLAGHRCPRCGEAGLDFEERGTFL